MEEKLLEVGTTSGFGLAAMVQKGLRLGDESRGSKKRETK